MIEEVALKEGASVHQSGQTLRLPSPSEVCQELEADAASVYRRVRSGEIPSLKSGYALKVRREDLEEYMNVSMEHAILKGPVLSSIPALEPRGFSSRFRSSSITSY